MLLDELADFIAVFIGHDDVCDDHIGASALDLAERGGGIAIGDDIDVLTPESDLDDLTHGGAIVNEVNGWSGGH